MARSKDERSRRRGRANSGGSRSRAKTTNSSTGGRRTPAKQWKQFSHNAGQQRKNGAGADRAVRLTNAAGSESPHRTSGGGHRASRKNPPASASKPSVRKSTTQGGSTNRSAAPKRKPRTTSRRLSKTGFGRDLQRRRNQRKGK